MHTKIMGRPISFNFLSAAKQKEVANQQSSSIYKQINMLQIKQNLIQSLQEGVSYLRIEEHYKTLLYKRKYLILSK